MSDKKYPQRHSNHSLEESSITFFRQHLPKDWNLNSVDRDYGQDLNIEIAEAGGYRGLELIIQLKSSANADNYQDTERQTFNISTYNYLWGNLRVVLIVKYIESENEAYWILLKDVPEPNQDNETFTMRIPRANSLSTINWDEIKEYVRNITMKKLKAVRPKK
jgi:hypothetical protein